MRPLGGIWLSTQAGRAASRRGEGDSSTSGTRKSSEGHGAGDGSDVSRIGRQQKFLQAVAARCLLAPISCASTEIIREGAVSPDRFRNGRSPLRRRTGEGDWRGPVESSHRSGKTA